MNRPVLRYFGGKFLLAPWIISHMPPHKIYVEPFGGAASVLMRKPRSRVEIYNDLDGEIVSLFRILRDPEKSKALENKLKLTPFSREEFNGAYSDIKDEIEIARNLIIRSLMGFGSNGHRKQRKTGFRGPNTTRASTPADEWSNYPENIERFTERLRGVIIESQDALKLIQQRDGKDTLFFLDPPYIHDSRGAQANNYSFEMDDEAHELLVDKIRSLKGMAILSGYDNPIYRKLGWRSVCRNSHTDGAFKRKECLWLNKRAWEAARN